MTKRIVFVHTVPSAVSQFTELARELLPGVEAWHVLDEILAKVVVAQGRLSPSLYRRLAQHLAAAEEAGATAVQVTCSSVSPCVDVVRSLVGIPVFKIDDAMVDRALGLGRRIAVAATAPTALMAVGDLVVARAAAQGKQVDLQRAFCEGAYAGLTTGDMASHDRIVQATLESLCERCDVILLAQASMTRVADAMPPGSARVPILTSPRFAVERLHDWLASI